MSTFDRLFGRDEQRQSLPERGPAGGPAGGGPAGGPDRASRSPDEIALERYRYLLRTAPPEQIEQAHAEAFARLTPEQRRMALQQLAAHVPETELQGARDDPRSLARLATRAELRQPGTIERAFAGRGQPGMAGSGGAGGYSGHGGGGIGLGSIFLYSLAASFIGTSIAQAFFADHGYPDGDPGGDPGNDFAQGGYDTAASGDDGDGRSSGGSWGDDGGDPTTDFRTADAGADDFGGDAGAAGDPGDPGDFGGGDF